MFRHGGTARARRRCPMQVLQGAHCASPIGHGVAWKTVDARPTDSVGGQPGSRRVCGATAGHWGLGNPALTVSRRRCGTMPYTSSSIARFPPMRLSPRPFGSREGGRLGVICLALRPPQEAIRSVRTMAHPFAASGSSLSVAPCGTRLRDGPLSAMDLVVAIGVQEDPVVPAVCAASRSPDDVVVMPSRHLGDGVCTDRTAPVLFLPEVAQAPSSVVVVREFDATALLAIAFPRRVVWVCRPVDLHLPLQPQACGRKQRRPFPVCLSRKPCLAPVRRSKIRGPDPADAFMAMSPCGPGSEGVADSPIPRAEGRATPPMPIGTTPLPGEAGSAGE
jgi:hypothetical protein